jgi:ribose transport system permease protein
MQVKSLGIVLLLLAILLVTSILQPGFVSNENLQSLIRWTSLFGFCSIGVAFVIITGGIDLSIGSLIALSGCLMIILLDARYEPTGRDATVTAVSTFRSPSGRVLPVVEFAAGAERPAPDDRYAWTDRFGSQVQATVLSVETAGAGWRVTMREPGLLIEPGKALAWSKFRHRPVPLVLGAVLLVSLLIGLVHGLLVTKIRLQPFVVTLCGLLIYRSLSRILAGDRPLGLGTTLDQVKLLFRGDSFSLPVPLVPLISQGHWSPWQWDRVARTWALDEQGQRIAVPWMEWIPLPMTGLLLLVVGVFAWLLLNRTLFGRYLIALGSNPAATRYSGINNDRMVICAYMICSLMAGLSGILFTFDLNVVEPSNTGNFYELYAIAAAVLGGCSLRGGSGSIIGVVIGTAVMRSLYLSIEALGIPKAWELTIIGVALLTAVLADEVFRLVGFRRQLAVQRKLAEGGEPAGGKG